MRYKSHHQGYQEIRKQRMNLRCCPCHEDRSYRNQPGNLMGGFQQRRNRNQELKQHRCLHE